MRAASMHTRPMVYILVYYISLITLNGYCANSSTVFPRDVFEEDKAQLRDAELSWKLESIYDID